MLIRLAISHIVLIEDCDIHLRPGLCVLSGETGAGKTILLDALGLALGARADAALVRQGQAQGSVAAEFDISKNPAAQAILKELEIEADDALLIRRTVAADGKTRCFVNDQTVTVSALKKLGETLVEIHGQHDQRGLQEASQHRDLLDDYAGLGASRKSVAEAHKAWREAAEQLAVLKAEIEQSAREQEYLKHMRAELGALKPEPGEEEELAESRNTMMQSEKLFAVLNEAIALLNQKEVTANLRSAVRTLTRSPLTSGLTAIIEGLDKAATEAEEALYQLEKTGQDTVYQPEKLEQIEERLFALRAASRKYNLPVDELATLHEEVEEKLKSLDSKERQLAKLEGSVAEAKAAYAAIAEKLSAARKKAAAKLEKSVEAELAPLKMGGTRFRVRVEPLLEATWSKSGSDAVCFECATNVSKGTKDVAFAGLSKIASGGELSRFMLALKVALAATNQPSTMIFDEIDAGTGGAVADAIGQRLSRLGKAAQVLVVTHLPQVAARGNQHFLVAKRQQGKKIVTEFAELSVGAREEELARMLAGATITPEARKAAQKLLEEAA